MPLLASRGRAGIVRAARARTIFSLVFTNTIGQAIETAASLPRPRPGRLSGPSGACPGPRPAPHRGVSVAPWRRALADRFPPAGALRGRHHSGRLLAPCWRSDGGRSGGHGCAAVTERDVIADAYDLSDGDDPLGGVTGLSPTEQDWVVATLIEAGVRDAKAEGMPLLRLLDRQATEAADLARRLRGRRKPGPHSALDRRLGVLVDDLATLADEHPEWVLTMADLAKKAGKADPVKGASADFRRDLAALGRRLDAVPPHTKRRPASLELLRRAGSAPAVGPEHRANSAGSRRDLRAASWRAWTYRPPHDHGLPPTHPSPLHGASLEGLASASRSISGS